MDPTNIVALSSLGAIRYQQNRLDEAEEYLRKAVAAAPNDSTRAPCSEWCSSAKD